MTKEDEIREAGNIIYGAYIGQNYAHHIAATRLYHAGFRKQKTGTWSLEPDEEMPDPMFKHVVCSACKGKANTTYKFCPNCGAKMGGYKDV